MKILAACLAVILVFLLAACWALPGDRQTEHTNATEDTAATETTEPTQLPTETVTLPTEPPETEPSAPTQPEIPVEHEDGDFVRIVDYIPDARVELPYATQDNFTGTVIYEFTDAYLRYGTVKKLAAAAAVLREHGYGLVIWDGYRPVYAQQKLWDCFPDPNYVSKPGTGSQSHCRGIAVDVTLYDLETGEQLEMPSGFDEFSSMGDRDYAECSETVRENVLLLENVMKNCGFKPYSGEWWHFSDSDSYEVEYEFDPAGGTETEPQPTDPSETEPQPTDPPETEPQPTDPSETEPQPTDPPETEPQPTDPLETEPQPTEPETTVPEEYVQDLSIGSLWYATCNQYMGLREKNDYNARSIARIYPNDVMTLLEWEGHFAKVSYNGKVGYVMSSYIKPVNGEFTDFLDTVGYDSCYTYDEMTADIQSMLALYPQLLTLDKIGYSEWGTEIPVIRVGAQDAQYHVLIHASIHAREHFTTWLVMAVLDYWLDNGALENTDVCYHIIPMVNPDGVHTAQTKTLTAEQKAIYQADLAAGYTNLSEAEYAKMWKANGVGVDLNRNFDAGWEQLDRRSNPSSELYKGTAPCSASEAAALRDYTLAWDFDATISYHSAGSLIYYQYGSNKQANAASKSLAKSIDGLTGYALEGSYGVDSGGYKDWALDKLGIASVTIEVGINQPVDCAREAWATFARNCDVMTTIAQWIREQE